MTTTKRLSTSNAQVIAESLNPRQHGILMTGGSDSRGRGKCIGSLTTIKALQRRGLVDGSQEWTALGWQVAQILDPRVAECQMDIAHDEALAEDAARAGVAATTDMDTQAIAWRTSAGARTGVETAYIGNAEHASYLVESRPAYHSFTGRTEKEFRAFRMVGGKHVPCGDGKALRTRKEAYAQAEADYANVLADRKAEESAAALIESGIKALDSICLRAGEDGHTLHMAAQDETCRVPQVADEDAETVHFWPDVDPSKTAACGVDIMRSEYTYGSPVWAEVDCAACLAKQPADAPPVHYGLSKERSGYTACGKHVEDVMFTFDDARVTCPDCVGERAECECAVRGSANEGRLCKVHDVEPAPEQGMTFTAAEVRIIRAALAETSTAGLRAAGVDPEAYDALWKRVKSGN